ncbi:MAG: flagellar hook-length control protein FliK [Porticoccaceae bacterium]|nr:flagellar hook-length control protein FliK [Porticoccaceae bacterium]
MGDLNNLILNQIKLAVTPATADSTKGLERLSSASGETANEVATDFAAILQDSLGKKVASQSGKPLPQSVELNPSLEPALKEADAELISNPLESRSLQSGLRVMVGGQSPSSAGVDAFAKSQGIDPHALTALMGASKKPQLNGQTPKAVTVESADPVKTHGIDPLALTALMGASKKQELHGQTPKTVTVESGGPIEATSNTEMTVDSESKPIAAWLSDSVIAQLVTTAPAARGQERQTIEAFLQKPNKFNSLDETPIVARRLKGTVQTTPWAEQLTDTIKSKSINAQLQELPLGSKVEKLTLNLSTSTPLSKNLDSLKANQEHLPAVKLEAINLAAREGIASIKVIAKEANATNLANVNLAAPQAPVTVVSNAPTSMLGESGFISAPPPLDSRAESSPAQALLNQLDQQSTRKQHEQADMSRRLAEALGQRLSAQISRGAWRVEMDLHPKSLGRIEIQLEMKNGEIEANFTTANAATRELLQDSMPRLRDALDEHGMKSAYIGLGMGNQAQSDGKSTSQNSQHNAGERSTDEEAGPRKHIERIDNDGLDVLV